VREGVADGQSTRNHRRAGKSEQKVLVGLSGTLTSTVSSRKLSKNTQWVRAAIANANIEHT
jgi:hypothetical protein